MSQIYLSSGLFAFLGLVVEGVVLPEEFCSSARRGLFGTWSLSGGSNSYSLIFPYEYISFCRPLLVQITRLSAEDPSPASVTAPLIGDDRRLSETYYNSFITSDIPIVWIYVLRLFVINDGIIIFG